MCDEGANPRHPGWRRLSTHQGERWFVFTITRGRFGRTDRYWYTPYFRWLSDGSRDPSPNRSPPTTYGLLLHRIPNIRDSSVLYFITFSYLTVSSTYCLFGHPSPVWRYLRYSISSQCLNCHYLFSYLLFGLCLTTVRRLVIRSKGTPSLPTSTL